MALTITIPGAVEATIGATAPAVLTVGVGTPGATGPAGATGAGVAAGGSTGQYLVKASATSYDTAWLTLPANYVTSVTAPLAVTAGNLAVDLSSYLTSATAASTYQTLAGMSSYLTTATAASTYAAIAAGQPISGTVGQVLTKNSGTNYDSSWATLIPGDRYLTTSTTSLSVGNGVKTLTVQTGLSYSPQQDIVIAYDATAHMHAVVTTYNSGTGVLVCNVTNHTGSGTFSLWTVNVGGTTPLQSVYWGEILGTLGDQSDLATALNAKLETSTAASTYAALAGAVFTGEVSTPASTTGTAGFSILPGVAPTSPVNGEFWNTGSDLQVRLSGVTETLAKQSWVTSQGYLTSSALTPYAPLAGATFTGLVTTVAATTTTAGLNIPHGAAPTSPVNGDIWTTTGGVFARINAGTTQLMNLGSTQTVSGSITFSNAAQTLGNSTAASTVNVATGATLTATTKNVNIGTGGVSGSTTNTTIGPVLGASTTSIGGTTAASTLNLASGATLTATTKAVNVGTSGVAGSTTTIAIGSTTGTSTTTLQGTTNGITAAVDTNSVALATTAYVVGQAGSATPIVDGTAAVGTSLRYARQDHVHPTDTSRAPLASPSLTGTPLSTTAAADTNTTQIATTAYVVGQASSTAPVIDGTATIGTSLKYARADHVHPTDTSRAALASPTFTGTPLSTTAAVDTNTTQIATTAYVVGQGYAKLASPTFTGTPSLPTGTTAVTQTAGNNTTAVATTAFVKAAVPAIATLVDSRQFTNDTKAMSPRDVLWSMLSQDFVNIDASEMTVTNTGTITFDLRGQLSRIIRPGNAGACSSRIRTFGISQVDQTWTASSRAQPSSYLNFSLRSIHSGRTTTSGVTDANYTCAVYYGKAEADGTGDLIRRGYGWKMVGGAGSRYLQLQAHNGTTLSNVTSSFAVTAGVAFDWDIESDGAGNVALYVNGSSVATSTGGPTGSVNITGVTWQEEVVAAAALSSPYMDFVNSRGRYIVINTW